MRQEKTSMHLFFAAVLLLVLSATGLDAKEQKMPFPQYGTGPVEVRIYSDYFCPPCRAMKPQVDPILRELLKRNAITLIWVDTPFSRKSVLYARYFLYAMKRKNNADHAFGVRQVLYDATLDRQMTTEAHLEGLFKSKGIPYEVFEPKPVFDRLNALIKEDKVNATPTCVIVRDGGKASFLGGQDIATALQGLR